jgi:hypothetical protein
MTRLPSSDGPVATRFVVFVTAADALVNIKSVKLYAS